MNLAKYLWCLIVALWSVQICQAEIIDTAHWAQMNETIANYIELGETQTAIDTGLYVILNVEKLSQKYPGLYGETSYYIGFAYLLTGELEKGLPYLMQASKAWEKPETDEWFELKGPCLTYIGIIYQVNEDWNAASNNYENALAYVSHEVPFEWEPMTFHNLGLLFKELDQYPKSQEYYLEGLSATQKRINVFSQEADSLQWLKTLNGISSFYIDTDQLDSARHYLNISKYGLSLFLSKEEEADYYMNEGRFFEKKGFLSLKRKWHEEALAYHQKALNIRQDHGDDKGVLNSWINIGANYEYLSDYTSAIKAYKEGEKALAYAETQDSAKLFLNLSDAYSNIDQEDEAISYRNICSKLSLDQRTIKNILDYTKEKVVHISNLKLQKKKTDGLLTLTSIIAVFSMITFGLGMINMNHKKKEIELKLEQETLGRLQAIDEIERNILTAQNKAKEQTLNKVSKELHDYVGAGLAGLIREFKAYLPKIGSKDKGDTTHFEKLCSELNDYYEQVREMSHTMKAIYLKNGLLPSLAELQHKLERQGLAFELFTHKMKDVHFEQEIELNVFRIIQEALANVIKHAQATHTEVQLMFTPPKTGLDDGYLTVTIDDNGKGFDMYLQPDGIGLDNMRERAEALGGNFSIDSQLNKGCTIIVEIPIPTYQRKP